MKRSHAGKFILMALFAVACTDPPTSQAPQQSAGPELQGSLTPLQARIAQSVADRAARGLPVPKVSFEFNSTRGLPLSALKVKPGETYSYVATTVIQYNSPREAGLERWPDLTLSAKSSRALHVSSSAFEEGYVAKVESSFPGFWNRYQLGFEPRTYRIAEKGQVIPPRVLSAAPADASATAVTSGQSGQLVLGFSLDVLYRNWGTGFDLEVCDPIFGECATIESVGFSASVGVGVGLRLPIAGDVTSPQPMLEGSSYSGSSSVTGVDWSATAYSAAGVAPHDGHEWYADLYLYGCVTLSGAVDYEDCKGPNFNKDGDFATPFGPGASFPLAPIPVTIADFGVAGIDFTLTPNVGSDKIAAVWGVSGDASGGGDLQYTDPTSSVSLSPVLAVDGPGTAHYSVHDYRYYFNQFSITLAVDPWIDIEVWSDDWPIDIVTLDLSDLIGALDLSVGRHPGSSPTGLALDADILNVAPTAHVVISGGQVVDFNGHPTLMASVGDLLTLTGTAHDPGRDDLTLSWNWGDGPPAPDETALYPITGATGPNDATDQRAHSFASACLYDATFMAVDDDGASGEDHVSILITQTGQRPRLDGYWQHELGRNGAQLSEDVVYCYLAIVGRVSAVFSEARAAASLDDAFNVLNLRQNSGSELEKLDREIMVAWLNFASGAVGYAQLIDTNADGTADTPFNQVMQVAEAVRLNPAATVAALRFQTKVVHQVSVQL